MFTQPTVFVIEPDPGVRDAIGAVASILELRCETYTNGAEFLSTFDFNRPGCLVLEVLIPGMQGLLLQETLLRNSAVLPLIFLTSTASVSIAVHAMRAGALHFLEKPLREHDLWSAIQEAIEVDRKRREAKAVRDNIESHLSLLTEKEIAVLRLLAVGRSKRATAAGLDVSVRTVEYHYTNLMRKLKINSTTKLLSFALDAEHQGCFPASPIMRHPVENGAPGHTESLTLAASPQNGRSLEIAARWRGF
jgi:two-component system, LuxR family, response regulator FixJ